MAESYLRCPSEWYRTSLEPKPKGGVIVQVNIGATPSTSVDEYWDGEIPWLTPKEITGFTDNLIVSRTERTITQTGLVTCGAKLMPVGTVMLSKRAPVGAVAVNAVPMATNQGFLSFQCGKRLRALYLAFWLKANKPYLDKVANGSTYPEIYLSDLFEFEIAVPPIETQDKILKVLSALQFASLLGSPLEQSVTDPAQMVAIQEQNRRLSKIRDQMLPLLLSGALEI